MSGDKKYIVIFKDSATKDDIERYADGVQQDGGGKVVHRYDTILKGFAATMSESHLSALQSNLQSSPIDYIEEDGVVTIQS
ncbi:hypothetical protein PILCRDRAFT_824052 [Piloderma croceum F 1598]|uniref:Inhibitor I9 domain-containing protein n=1 Tax=Piloderma croceum (strain F 1598) TaxID=765440 RepID=A0A0C3AY35_PILCF|nr:hypothetical protein PILCRDRAFT_824052 [Piloderma croceum F 1598]